MTVEVARPRSSRRRIPAWVAWVVTAALAVLFAWFLRVHVVTTFSIPSGSMEPTLDVGDRIVVDRLSYDLHGVRRGDIIVFRRPADENCGDAKDQYLVKRVIGLPRERISSLNGTVEIDGRPLAEPWLPPHDDLGPPIPATTIPAGNYYMLGDNRSDSCDSRFWGPLSGSLIVGRAEARVWPLSRLHWF